MALIDRIVDIKITRNTKGLTKPEFSTILIIGNSKDEEEVDRYFSLAELPPKYPTTSNEYKAAALIFGQTPTVTSILIGQTKESESIVSAYNRIGATFNFYAVVPLWVSGSTLTDMTDLAAAVEASGAENATSRILGLIEIDEVDFTLMAAIKNANYSRTFVIFNSRAISGNAIYPNAAWFGALLPTDPGTQTWAYKTLVGIAADIPTDGSLSNSQMLEIDGLNGNYYTNFGGRDVTINGKMGSGEYIDIIYGIDWLENAMQFDLATLFVTNPRIPYTNQGIGLVRTAMSASLDLALSRGVIDSYKINTPDITAVSFNDKANRELKNVSFEATLTGAIHKITIQGYVTL